MSLFYGALSGVIPFVYQCSIWSCGASVGVGVLPYPLERTEKRNWLPHIIINCAVRLFNDCGLLGVGVVVVVGKCAVRCLNVCFWLVWLALVGGRWGSPLVKIQGIVPGPRPDGGYKLSWFFEI